MSRPELTEDLLTRLLVEAKDAHVEYEKQTGEYDEDWPRWYARYILERLETEQGEGKARQQPQE
jgi:hypothetical protein